MLNRMVWSALVACSIISTPRLVVADTSWVRVIFYDYRGNGSNPNFEQCNTGTLTPNLAAPALGPDRKPLLNRNVSCATWDNMCPLSSCHNRLSEWFRPSSTNGPDTSVRFVYDSIQRSWEWRGLVNYQGRAHEWTGPRFNPADPMANVIVYDSLPFVETVTPGAPRGTVEFRSDDFFRLNGKGFGNDFTRSPKPDYINANNNYGYAMELHVEFIYVGGEFFSFTGDDDVWAYIDGKLVIDLGGTHAPISGSFRMDSLAAIYGYQKGRKYSFDFFYCERHTWSSKIAISTNLIKPPSSIRLKTTGDNTVAAGGQLGISGEVYNIDGKLDSNYTKMLTWSITGTSISGDSLSTTSGPQTSLSATRAYRTVRIRASVVYTDPVSGTSFPVEEFLDIRVLPGAPMHIWMETLKGDSVQNLNAPIPQDRFYLPISQSTTTATAVLRDRFGNFAGFPTTPTWISEATQKVTIEPSPSIRHAAIVGKGISPSASVDSTRIIVRQDPLVSDTAWVVAQFPSGPLAIQKAVLFLGVPPGTTAKADPKDTLIVTFTQPVPCENLLDPRIAFRYVGKDSLQFASSARFDVQTTTCTGLTTTAIVLVDTGVVIPLVDSMAIDSIRPETAATKIDKGAKVIEWGRSYDPVIKVTVNPFSPTTSPINGLPLDMSKVQPAVKIPAYGVGIKVETVSISTTDLAASSVTIYDVVGNQVTQKLPAFPSLNGKSFYFLWDGRNQYQRIVGSGTYLGVVSIVNRESGTKMARVKIGVRN